MTQASGIISAVNCKNTQFGDLYELQVNGKNYKYGKFAPRDVAQGDFITFEFETKQNGQYTNYSIVRGSIRKDSAPAPAAVAAAVAETRTTVAAGDKKQETISKQANLNTAIQFVNTIISSGGLKFPATAKATDIYTLVDTLLLDTAARLYKLTTGDVWDTGAGAASPQLKKAVDKGQTNEVVDDEYADA